MQVLRIRRARINDQTRVLFKSRLILFRINGPNLRYTLIFELVKNNKTVRGKKLLKVVKFLNLVAKCCKIQKIQPCEVRKFFIFLYYVWKLPLLHFRAESGNNFRT